jgi:hypothetical protein
MDGTLQLRIAQVAQCIDAADQFVELEYRFASSILLGIIAQLPDQRALGHFLESECGPLFDSAAQSLLQFGRNRLRGDMGISAVLHTWGQKLDNDWPLSASLPVAKPLDSLVSRVTSSRKRSAILGSENEER